MRILLLLGVVTLHVTSLNNVMATDGNLAARQAVTRGINTFANNFFKAVAKDESGNLICSPISASMVLAMASYGARGETETALRSALVLGEDDTLTKTGIQSIIDNFNNYKQVELHLANKIFVANKFEPKAEFMKITEGFFRSVSESVDFGKAVEASNTINGWCAAKTNNRIKDLIKPNDVSPDTALVLVNAVYFKGNWSDKFDANSTQLRPFHVNKLTVKDVPTMYRSGSYRYGELPEVKAKFVELPYKSAGASDAVSMIIILPDEIEGLAELEKNFEKVTVDKLLRGNKRNVNLYLPKFKIESTLNLQDPLETLGLGDMFTDRANFSGIVDGIPLKVSKVVQKAFIEVNEEGSEAAAATGMTIMLMSLPPPPKEFVIDRPFVCMIVTKTSEQRSGDTQSMQTGAIIFQAKVADPTPR